jgi:hypothetical protein
MKYVASLLAISVFCSAAGAQTAHTTHPQDGGVTVAANTRDGGVDETLQSIYIPPLVNVPFTALVHTEWTRPLPDGGSYTFVNLRQVARDGRGRIYEERWLLVPKGSEDESRMNVIQIADPNAHTLYNCFTLQIPHRCILQTFAEPAVTAYKPNVFKSGPLPNNAGSLTHEDLGTRTIAGIETLGTRDTTNYNAGVMGSDAPFAAWREFWQSPQLGVNLYSEVGGPRVGKQLFTLTDLTLAEPDPKLFELPEGYTVVDRRKPAAEHPELPERVQ